jgi:phosphoribosyl 1,2-cyclic phosphodiesterase
MKYYILGSGSGGNSTALVNDKNEILLIDCGLPIIEIKRRLSEVGLDFDNVKKVLITHMHVDHVKSIKAFDPQNIYLNVLTEMNSSNLFDYYEEFELLGFHIYTLLASHDSPGTTGFLIQYNNEKMAYITDTGYIHENTQKIINNCDIYCIESNHDPRLLMLTKRPMFLKNRILSANGHMSNQDCAYVLGNIMGPKTKEIVFLHRSLEANTEEMIIETFMNTMKKMDIDVSKININIAKQDSPISYGSICELISSK